MKRLPFLLLAMFSLACAAAPACTDRPECWPEGSAMRTRLEEAGHADAQQKLLDAEYSALVELVASARAKGLAPESRLLGALTEQQAAWNDFMAKSCELAGVLTGAAPNWQSAWAAKCETAQRERRLGQLREVSGCIRRLPEDRRLFEQEQCLRQLATDGENR
jgi:uncharacterized protein YecT (DUF1311 family)